MTALWALLAGVALVYAATRPSRSPWDRTRVLRPAERLEAYMAKRGPLGEDVELDRRFCRGLHAVTTFALGGRIIRSWAQMLPAPTNEGAEKC